MRAAKKSIAAHMQYQWFMLTTRGLGQRLYCLPPPVPRQQLVLLLEAHLPIVSPAGDPNFMLVAPLGNPTVGRPWSILERICLVSGSTLLAHAPPSPTPLLALLVLAVRSAAKLVATATIASRVRRSDHRGQEGSNSSSHVGTRHDACRHIIRMQAT